MAGASNEWEQKLSPEQFHILFEKGTETPYTGILLFNDAAGDYVCAACGNVLFGSDVKFDAHCGWPGFYDARPGSVVLKPDTSHGMARTEVTCAKCGGHLGHVFDDAPDQPTGQRYCINSLALDFAPEENS